MKLSALHSCVFGLLVACADDPVVEVAPPPSTLIASTGPGLAAVVDLDALQLRGGERPLFTNDVQGLNVQFDDDGSVAIEVGAGTGALRTRPNDGVAMLRLRTSGWGREGRMNPIAGVERARTGAGACDGTGRTTRDGRCLVRAEIERAQGAPTEWWANDEHGLEQGWTFNEAPQGHGLLAVTVEVEGWMIAVDSDRLGATLLSGDDRVRYAGLRAWDADGVELASWMTDEAGGLKIVVDDAGANYPVTIDPLLSAAAWMAESNLEGAQFGNSVAAAGDVNGDGFEDVIVGAPAFSNGQTSEGRAFVYLGSANGLAATTAWTAENDISGAAFGLSVDGAGDVNGDGFDDVIIGAPGTASMVGRAYVYLGSASGLGMTPAWTVVSDQVGALYGFAVTGAGDVDGDGYSDVVVGASHHTNGETAEGRTLLYRGSASGLSTVASWSFESDHGGGEFGTAVDAAGDVNGDGFGDVIVGAPYYDYNGSPNVGTALLFHGGSSGLGSTPAWTLPATPQAHAVFGIAVSGAGDVNGDGYADVLVGAEGWDEGQVDEGLVLLFYGRATGLGPTPWSAQANVVGARSGRGLGYADINGDGYSDFVVGAWRQDNGQPAEGGVQIFHGGPTGPTNGVYQEVNQADAAFGYSVGGAGDVNGDGFGDVIAGAFGYDNGASNEGGAWLYYGAGAVPQGSGQGWEGSSAGAHLGDALASAGDVNADGYDDFLIASPQTNTVYLGLGSATGAQTLARIGAAQSSGYFGSSVAGAGDVNGDGFEDVIVGAPDYAITGADGVVQEGFAYVYLGNATGIATSPIWSTTYQRDDIYEDHFARFGASVSSAGDVNGDGFDDIVVGAASADGIHEVSGTVYVYLGSALGPAAEPHRELRRACGTDSEFGRSVSSAGDTNGDGYDDVIIGSHFCGAALHLGEVNGLAQVPTWAANGSGHFGWSVAGVGDIDGDGYDDVVVGSPAYTVAGAGGRVSLYRGSSSGLVFAMNIDDSPAGNQFGYSVAGAGDVNGDGLADVLIGSPYADGEGLTDRGYLYLYLGSRSGQLVGARNWGGGQNSAFAGFAVAGAGDVNGDGFADVLGTTIGHGNYAGIVYLYFGGSNDTTTNPVAVRTRAERPGTSRRIPVGLRTTADGAFDVAVGSARSPFGRTKVRLEVEVKVRGVAFNGQGLTRTGYVDSGLLGATLEKAVTGIGNGPVHWRARVGYHPAAGFVQSISAWKLGDVGSGRATHVEPVRYNTAPVAVADAVAVDVGGTALVAVLANDSDAEETLAYSQVTIVEPPLFGTATVVVNGISYVHGGLESVQDAIVYQVCDGARPNFCDTASVSIVTGEDAAPLASLVRVDTNVGAACEPQGNGGQRIMTGRDDGLPAGTPDNGALEDGEVESTSIVCNGSVGDDGFSAIIVSDNDVGAGCATFGNNGGTRVRSGLDDGSPSGSARSGTLEDGEVDATSIICNGANGTDGNDGEDGSDGADGEDGSDGADGFDTIVVTDVQVGSGCDTFGNGGLRIRVGRDDGASSGTARNGVLEEGEVESSTVLCHGADGEDGEGGQDGNNGANGQDGSDGFDSLVVTDANVGAACASFGNNGGTRVRVGVDDGAGTGTARNRLLEDDEVDATAVICNGADGEDGADGSDGQNGEDGEDGEDGANGADGFDTIVVTDTQIGTGCDASGNGGLRIRVGRDDGTPSGTSRNGTLEAGEVESSTVLCHGADGADGQDGSDGSDGEVGFDALVVTDADVGAACASFGNNGGTRVRVGLDDGGGGGTARNRLLEEDEVDTTAIVCNGADGTDGQNGEDGANGADGFDTVVVTDTQVGTGCDAFGNGGLRIRFGRDDGTPSGTARNGTLEAGEVESSTVLCHGGDGEDGQDGEDGNDGSDGSDGEDGFDALVVTDTNVGSACASFGNNGGTRVRVGVDDGSGGGVARNRQLELGEVDATAIVCNGASGAAGEDGQDGQDGQDGFDAIVLTDGVVGASCAGFGNSGGSRVRVGIDNGDGAGLAGNGTLEVGEVDATSYVCNGATGSAGAAGANGWNGVVVSDADVAGNCGGRGGVRIRAGSDDGAGGGTAGDGALQSGEVDATSYVCNGATGANGEDGADGEDGTDGEDGAAGANGRSALVSTDASVGNACDSSGNGGVRVRVGLDDGAGGGVADDGVLQLGEVDATSYVCNGRNGTTGATGSDGGDGANGANGYSALVIADDVVGAMCAAQGNGGRRIRAGTDDGAGGGIANDGQLQSGEVDAVSYVCNGANGTNGTSGQNGTPGQNGQDGQDGEDGQDGSVGPNGFDTLIVADAVVGGSCDAFANGGQRFRFGLDDGLPSGTARNGRLEPGEIDATTYVCAGADGSDGAPGETGHSGIVSVDASVGSGCDAFGNGGQRVRTGIDDGRNGGVAGNGVLESGEIRSTALVCNGADGPRGYPTIFRSDDQVGDECDAFGNGGTRVLSGVDDGAGGGTADNADLEVGEIDTTTIICNGRDGVDGDPGARGHDAIITWDAAVGDACRNMGGTGTRIQSGLDDGTGQGFPDDGVLHADEVDHTSFVCDGAPGRDGAAGYTSLVATDDVVGDQCASGSGTRVRVGVDDGSPSGTAGDGALDEGEIDATTYVCDGESREGAPGHQGLVEVTQDGSGCASGNGLKVTNGTDDGSDGGVADNGRLEPGEIAPGGTHFVCDGLRAVTIDNGGCSGGDGPLSIVSLGLWFLIHRFVARRRSDTRR